ncbi:exonuclease [Streptomyces phage TrvxScott]|nr:exonuclease [Streptomyces phage TrvxScott]
MSELVDALLAKPTAPAVAGRKTDPEKDFTRQIEIKGDEADVTVRGETFEDNESAATAVLQGQGLDPAEWTVTGLRSSEWTMANGDTGVSTRFTFARCASVAARERPPIDELIAALDSTPVNVIEVLPDTDGEEHTFLVCLGDMQFGKIDGDGVEGTLQRTIDCLNRAAELLVEYRMRFNIRHVHIAWLGDHVEGFVSQGGANTWRTQLTMNEQIRLTRRVMLHALLLFAPVCSRLTMAAVPGNHGEAVRISGKGVTRYDDSHDTESLIAVKDAAELNPDRFGHVEFYVPDTDELIVVVECSGTVVGHAHGHQWRPGKHFEWWKGQAFNQASPMHLVDLLLAGHLHHEFIDTDGWRTFLQPPAMESESTWWRHSKGTTGAPGLVVAVTKDGRVPVKEVVSQ